MMASPLQKALTDAQTRVEALTSDLQVAMDAHKKLQAGPQKPCTQQLRPTALRTFRMSWHALFPAEGFLEVLLLFRSAVLKCSAIF